MKRLRLIIWKYRLKRSYLRYRRIAEEFSCGNYLSNYVSHRLRQSKNDVNAAIRRCRELDPSISLEEIK